MADLSSLIRLHKHELDEKQRQIGLMYDELQKLEDFRDKIIERREQEVRIANEQPETVTYTLSGYLEKSKAQEYEVNSHIFQMNQKIEALRDDMLDSFAELKKYELTQAERLRVEEQERKLKEGRMFDDIAIEGFRKQQDDS